MPRFINLTDKRFGRLVVLYIYRRVRGHTYWWCQCDCGNSKDVDGTKLKSKDGTKSCGCLKKEVFYRHGMSFIPEYKIWSAMIQRCLNLKNKAFINYGGRGITVCQRWRLFEHWYTDMGKRPDDLTLERRDNDGNYSCGTCEECLVNGWTANCYWATAAEQARNKRTSKLFTINGRTQCLQDWIKESGLPFKTVSNRLVRGKSIEEALNPITQVHIITYNDITQSLAEWSRQTGIGATLIKYRIDSGWSIERALTDAVEYRTKRVLTEPVHHH